MTGAVQVRGVGIVRNGGTNRGHPIGCRDSGGNSDAGFDGYREARAESVAVIGHHHRQFQRPASCVCLSTLIDDLALGERPSNESAAGDVLEFLGRVDKHFDIASSKASIEVGKNPVKTIKIALFGLLDQNEIDIALPRLAPLGERSEKNGFLNAVFPENRCGAFDDVVKRGNLAIH
jgi:hypothetical protein